MQGNPRVRGHAAAPVSSLPGLRRLASRLPLLLSCAALLAVPVAVHAASVSGPGAAARGATVMLSFSDTVVAFEAADFQVAWDAGALTLVELQAGSLTPGAFIAHDASAAGAVQVSLAAAMPVTGAAPDSLFRALFQVNGGASGGPTTITFKPSAAPVSDYAFAPVSATVEVVDVFTRSVP
jgi:hypothetical protein